MTSTAASVVEKVIEKSSWFRRIYEKWPEEVKKYGDSEALTPMDKKSFVKFAKWLAKCEGEIGDWIAFEQQLAEALTDKSTYAHRINQIVSRIFDIFLFDLVPCSDKERGVNLGGPLMHSLHCLAMSASADEVRVQAGPNKDVCVLVTGFAGSHVDEIQPQVDFYNSLGFATVSTTRCVYPHVLHVRQLLAVAQALIENMTGDTKLIVHCVSGNGTTFWGEIGFHWVAALPPFNELPPLEKCLKGLILECAPPAMPDPKTNNAMTSPAQPFYEECGGDAQWAGLPQDLKAEWHDVGSIFITLGSIGSLCTFHCTDVNMHRLSSTKPELMSYVRKACTPRTDEWNGWFYQNWADAPSGYSPNSYETLWNGGLEAVCERMDIDLFGGRLPKLFLYTARDVVIRQEQVEAYINYMQRFWPEESIQVHMCKEASHCKLFNSDEREGCVKATTQLLEAAGVLSPTESPPSQ